MSKPSDYYDIRATVLKDLKQTVIKNVNREYYALLTTKDIGATNCFALVHLIPIKQLHNLHYKPVKLLMKYKISTRYYFTSYSSRHS